jgi:CDGSH-type Zn-finger protein/quercetin dioxygenase-like cupin family protein
MPENKTDLPNVARYKPYYQELEQGKSYFWCSCGLSRQQPYCDGSHKGTGFEPVRYTAVEDNQEVLFCGCKHSADQPFCDGAHNDLKEEYDEDDPNSPENLAIPTVEAAADGRAMLNGGCFVAKVGQMELESKGNLRIGHLITAATGARHQSQFYAECGNGESPVIHFGDRHCILLATAGQGNITISGREFSLAPETGVYVRPGEAFAVDNPGTSPIKLFIAVCPLAEQVEFLTDMPSNFEAAFPTRTVAVDPDKRQTMADRFFQVLVDKSIGSDVVTQFIGDIPQSKAAMHRHLYEESIVVLKGKGFMWTEDMKTPVESGDVIFLPRKQVHSLECTDPGGMMLAGVIYPGDNPSINY